MFDNTKPNIILMSDFTDIQTLSKTFGPFKIAHCLREAGFEVQVIHHLSVFSISEICELLRCLVSSKTLYVGFNNFFYQNLSEYTINDDDSVTLSKAEPGSLIPHGKHYNQIIKDVIKSQNPWCKLVLGGPTVNDLEHNTIFDYMISGYGEISAVNLAQHLLDPAIPLLKSRRSVFGSIIIDDPKAEGYDFQHSTMRYADNDVILPGETLMLEVSRGCIFKCAFCAFPMNGKKKSDYIRHMDLIREEVIDNWQRFGITRYQLADDTVNDSVEKCEFLAEMISSLPFKLEWWGYIRLDLLSAHPRTIDHLFDNGLRGAFFGIETLNARTATAIGKGGDRKKQMETLKFIKHKYGDKVNLHGSFIFGLPYENIDSMNATIEWLFSKENPLDTWQAVPLSIRPKNNGQLTDFVSDLELNFEKYGYRSMGTISQPTTRWGNPRLETLWENDFTDRLKVTEMCSDVNQRKQQSQDKQLDGISSFNFAGLVNNLDRLINAKITDINYTDLSRIKMQRAQRYKMRIFQINQIPQISHDELWPKTYRQQIIDGVLTT